jgi:hypothetical protein
MILILIKLVGSLMNFVMFQEQYGIEHHNQEQGKGCQGAYQGTWDMDFCRYRMQSGQEGLLYLEFFSLAIPKQRIYDVVTG